ncbi:Nn.00g037050.m01.CDS01 [Neocucurbitaria sp. VM-36]
MTDSAPDRLYGSVPGQIDQQQARSTDAASVSAAMMHPTRAYRNNAIHIEDDPDRDLYEPLFQQSDSIHPACLDLVERLADTIVGIWKARLRGEVVQQQDPAVSEALAFLNEPFPSYLPEERGERTKQANIAWNSIWR